MCVYNHSSEDGIFDSLPIGPDIQETLEAASKARNRVSGASSLGTGLGASYMCVGGCVCPWVHTSVPWHSTFHQV